MNFKTKQITSPLLAILWVILILGSISVIWLFGYDNQLLTLIPIGLLLVVLILPLQTIKFPKLPSWVYIIVAVSIVGLTLFMFVGLVPAPLNYDEALLAIWSNYFFKTGDPLLPGYFVQTPYYALYPMGALLTTLGITFTNARIVVIFLALLSLPFVYSLVNRHFGKAAGLFTIIYGVIVIVNQSYYRVDSLAPLGIAIGMYCYDRANGRLGWYILSGFAFAITIEAHPLAVVYGVALGIILTFQYLKQIQTEKKWAFNPFWGLLVGGVFFILIYFLSRTIGADISLSEYLARSNSAFQKELATGQDIPFPDRVPIIFISAIFVFIVTSPLNALIISVGLVTSKRNPKLRLWIAVLVIGNILSALINPKHSVASYTYYMLHSLPIVLFILAGVTEYMLNRFKLFASVSLMLVIILFTWVVMYRQQFGYNGTEQIELGYEINTFLPPEVDVILGWETYYWGLSSRQFYMNDDFRRTIYTVQERLNILNLETFEAVIVTYGLDDNFKIIQDYLIEKRFERVQCYEIPTMNLTAELYVLPTILPDIRNEGCP
jgi:hypothetical protein